MSAHGPYVLQDGPTKKFWRDFDGAAVGVSTGEWIDGIATATQYATKAEAEFARANRRVGVGRAAMCRIHIVALADLANKKTTRAAAQPSAAANTP